MDIKALLEDIREERPIPEKTVKKICKKVQEIFMSESNLINVSAPVNVVGDVHGQFYDVLKLFSLGEFSLTQVARSLIPNICSLGTMLTGATTRWRPSSISFA